MKPRFIIAVSILLSVVTSVPPGRALARLTPGLIDKNNEAVKLLESEKNFEAYKTLTDGLADSPFQDELHLNLGFAFERNGEKAKALAEYEQVAKTSPNLEFRFQALFNAARLQGEAKKIDEALKLYQQALELAPDSNEVKTNIELLLASGGGGGNGDDNKEQKPDDSKDPKDGDGNKDPKKGQGPKPTPQPFKSGELNKQDVKNILDELRRQENQIRAKENEKKPKENRSGKDW
ncbi:MAG: tetratricopeptide repeat protein [Bdellovibrionia bacterium]